MLVPRNVPIVDKVALRSIHVGVNAFIRKFNLPKADRDDLVQDVALHLIQQAENFNPTVGAWSTFVKCVIRSKLASIRRASIGDVPEITAHFGEDPRELQRLQIDFKGLWGWREASQVRNHINFLAAISANAPTDLTTRNSYITTVRGGLLTIRNRAMGLTTTMNFSRQPVSYTASGQGILSEGLESGQMQGFGYELSRIRRDRDGF